jgi:hypothetical protein
MFHRRDALPLSGTPSVHTQEQDAEQVQQQRQSFRQPISEVESCMQPLHGGSVDADSRPSCCWLLCPHRRTLIPKRIIWLFQFVGERVRVAAEELSYFGSVAAI